MAVIAGVSVAGLAVARLRLRGAVEDAVTQALGRQFTIAGPLDVSLGRIATVTAEDLRVANAAWGAAPHMLRVQRVRLSVDAASVLSRPVRVCEVEIEGVRVALEADKEGRWNWMPDRKPKAAAPRRPATPAPAAKPPAKAPPPPRPLPPPIVVEHVSVRDLVLEWRTRRNEAARAVSVVDLEARVDRQSGMIGIDARGALDDAPWSVAGRVGTYDALVRGSGVEHDLTASLSGATLAARGTFGKLASLADPRLDIACEGDDVGQTLRTVGLDVPLSGPFRLRGRMTPAERGVAFDAEAGVASVSATARGRFATLLRPGTIDATVHALGSDASVVGTWTRVAGLPQAPFDVTGRVLLAGRRLDLDGVRVLAGGTSVVVRGTVGLVRGAAGTELSVEGGGHDLAELRALTRVMLPAGPFTVRGTFLRRADALAIDAVEVVVSGATVRAGGTIGEPPRLPNLDLSVDASGSDFSPFSGIARVTLPRAPFELRGRVARDGRSFVVDGVDARVGDDVVNGNATLTRARRLAGSEIDVRASGPALSVAAGHAGLHGSIPATPYELSGRVRIVDGGYDLSGVLLRAGTVTAGADGHVAARSAKGASSSLELRATGLSLSELSSWGLGSELPAVPFEASARVGIAPGRVDVQGGEASLGDARVRLDGAIGLGGRLRGTDIRFDARAPDTSLASALSGVQLPEGRLGVSGHFVRGESSLLFDGIEASVGAIRATIDGTIGEAPRFAATSIAASASGPDLALALGPPTGGLPLPSRPFQISTRLDGDESRFAANDLRAQLGGSDLAGAITIARGPRPVVDVDLRSRHLDFVDLLGSPAGAVPGQGAGGVGIGAIPTAPSGGAAKSGVVTRVSAAPVAGPRPPSPQQAPPRIFSDAPIPVATLRAFDARIRVPVDELVVAGYRVRDVTLAGALTDGVAQFERLEAVGPDGGRLTAGLVLEPSGEGYRLRGEGSLAGARLSVPGSGIAPGDAPPLDVEFELSGEGKSPHAIASSSDGRLLVTLGAGRLPNNLGDVISSGVGRALLEALNPFRASSPYTSCECGVAAVSLTQGRAAVEPVVARSDKLTIVGRGNVDFDTEAIELEWTLKPREGVGISAGSIANPYVGLGGTLAEPSLELKTAHAIASAGAAIATAGGTILLRGLYDRVTAEQQVCLKALELARGEGVPRSEP